MILDSVSHIVCKFQKDWLVNKIKAKFGDGPLNPLSVHVVMVLICSGKKSKKTEAEYISAKLTSFYVKRNEL